MPQKHCLLAILTAISFTAQAQNTPVILELEGKYNKRNVLNDTDSFYKPASLMSYNASLLVGFRLSKNWVGGVIMGYGKQNFVESYLVHSGLYTLYYTDQITNTVWTAGLFCRHTHFFNQWVFLYGQAEALIADSKNDAGQILPYATVAVPSNGVEAPADYGYLSGRLYPAVGINIVNGWGVNLSIGGIEYLRLVRQGYAATTSVNVTLGQQFNLGVHKFVGKPKGKTKKA